MPKDSCKSDKKCCGGSDSHVRMGAKISNQINTNQQSNMALSAYCVITQNCSTVNVNFV